MVNHMILQGRLVALPELRHTQSGVAVASFRVAWSRKYKGSETKLFLNCVAWRGTAEMLCKYFGKGQEIVVEGELNTRGYTDRDGNDRQVTELIVSQAHFCGPKSGGNNQPSGSYPENQFNELTEDDGELPF